MREYAVDAKYYCEDFDDLKKVSLDILRAITEWSNDDALIMSEISRCSYCEVADCCCCGSCVLLQHLDDKDVVENIKIRLQENEIDFPCVAYIHNKQLVTVPIVKLKSNTKFGAPRSDFGLEII